MKKYGKDIQIIIVDALTYAGNLASIKDEIELDNVSFVKSDIADYETIKSVFANNDIDYVVNFAAESHVDRSITNPKLFLETNIIGTQNMLQCAREAWYVGKDEKGSPVYKDGVKYLQISTDEVYGSLEKDFEEAQPLHVDDDVKKVIEGRDNLKTFGISITRCSNNYGPYHFPEKLIPLISKNILEGKKLPVYGKGLNVRDWLYVEDHCKGIDMVLRKGRVGEVYNIGGFNEESNINIVKQVIAIIAKIMREEPQYQKLLKVDLNLINDDLITYVADRPGHDMRYAIDPTKIAIELGWYPETPFTVGIEKTVRWNLDHQDWVESVTSGDYQKYYEQMYGNR